MKKNPEPQLINKAMTWLLAPWFLLLLTLIIYPFLHAFAITSGANLYTLVSILNMLLSLVGFIASIGIFVGFFMFIYTLVKARREGGDFFGGSIVTERQKYLGQLKGWSWGAFTFGIFWGIYNNVWISFLVFVPFVGFLWPLVLGFKGQEWAWMSGKWQSFEQFQEAQKVWDMWGRNLFIIGLVLTVLITIITILM